MLLFNLSSHAEHGLAIGELEAGAEISLDTRHLNTSPRNLFNLTIGSSLHINNQRITWPKHSRSRNLSSPSKLLLQHLIQCQSSIQRETSNGVVNGNVPLILGRSTIKSFNSLFLAHALRKMNRLVSRYKDRDLLAALLLILIFLKSFFISSSFWGRHRLCRHNLTRHFSFFHHHSLDRKSVV